MGWGNHLRFVLYKRQGRLSEDAEPFYLLIDGQDATLSATSKPRFL